MSRPAPTPDAFEVRAVAHPGTRGGRSRVGSLGRSFRWSAPRLCDFLGAGADLTQRGGGGLGCLQLRDLAFVLRLLTLQLRGEVARALLRAGSALALGCKLDLDALQLLRCAGLGVAASVLLFVEGLLCREQGGAGRLGLGGPGLLLLRKLDACLARGHALAIDFRKQSSLV